jgi:hypothetical protein
MSRPAVQARNALCPKLPATCSCTRPRGGARGFHVEPDAAGRMPRHRPAAHLPRTPTSRAPSPTFGPIPSNQRTRSGANARSRAAAPCAIAAAPTDQQKRTVLRHGGNAAAEPRQRRDGNAESVARPDRCQQSRCGAAHHKRGEDRSKNGMSAAGCKKLSSLKSAPAEPSGAGCLQNLRLLREEGFRFLRWRETALFSVVFTTFWLDPTPGYLGLALLSTRETLEPGTACRGLRPRAVCSATAAWVTCTSPRPGAQSSGGAQSAAP